MPQTHGQTPLLSQSVHADAENLRRLLAVPLQAQSWPDKPATRWWLLGTLVVGLILALPGPQWPPPAGDLSTSIELDVLRPTPKAAPAVTKTAAAEKKKPPQPVPDKAPPATPANNHSSTDATAPSAPSVDQPENNDRRTAQGKHTAVSADQLAAILSQQTSYTGEVRVSKDFQARSSDLGEYHPPAMLARQWSSPTPGLDLDADAPTTTVEFYDFGWQGHAERLFEKLLQKKTYVTRYGTRIECMQLMLMRMCGWGASEVNLSVTEQQQLDDLYSSLHNRPLWAENNSTDSTPEKAGQASPSSTQETHDDEPPDPFTIRARLGKPKATKQKFKNMHSRRWATPDHTK